MANNINPAPMFSIRYIVKQGDPSTQQLHKYLIPQTDYVNPETKQVESSHYGDETIAREHWEYFKKQLTASVDQYDEFAEAELLYGGRLLSNNTIVDGGQICEQIKKNAQGVMVHSVLWTPPSYQAPVPAASAPLTPVDVTAPGATTVPPPVVGDTSHMPAPPASEPNPTVAHPINTGEGTPLVKADPSATDPSKDEESSDVTAPGATTSETTAAVVQ